MALAAYLLIAQAALAGMILGAQAAPQPSRGIELCLPSGASDLAPQIPSETHVVKTCCVLGCAMFGAGAPPPDATLFAPSFGLRAVATAAPTRAQVSRVPDASPRSTRAPPSA